MTEPTRPTAPRPAHRLVGRHDEQSVDGKPIPHVECDCGWHGEIHVWAEHKDAEAAHD